MLKKISVLLLISVPALATSPVPGPNGSCKQVIDACEKASFTQVDGKNGRGLYVNCVNLIMQGEKQPAHSTINLPIVDSAVVADCKAKHPKFGEPFKKK